MNVTEIAKEVIAIEANEIKNLKIEPDFAVACDMILACKGRVIVIGIGKSGHIGRKIAATLASTGTPSFFVHPAEASHGDLGMITKEDVVILISNSGEADEILILLPILKRLNIFIIAMTGKKQSTLAKNSHAHINIGISKEACPLNLAPTSSTTATLVMGDAIAVSLLKSRGFTQEDFAFSHPAGQLGKKLLIKVSDIMHSGKDLPIVNCKTLFSNALVEMSAKRLGMVAIVDDNAQVCGVFTDGDLRRAFNRQTDFKNVTINQFMTKIFISVTSGILAESALHIMESNNINGLLVIDDGQLIGALNMLDLVHAKII